MTKAEPPASDIRSLAHPARPSIRGLSAWLVLILALTLQLETRAENADENSAPPSTESKTERMSQAGLLIAPELIPDTPPESMILDFSGQVKQNQEEWDQLTKKLHHLRDTHDFHLYVIILPVETDLELEERIVRVRKKWIGPEGRGLLALAFLGVELNKVQFLYDQEIDDQAENVHLWFQTLSEPRLNKARVEPLQSLDPRNMHDWEFILQYLTGYTDIITSYFEHEAPPSENEARDRRLLWIMLGIGLLIAAAILLAAWRAHRRKAKIEQATSPFLELEIAERLGGPYTGGLGAEISYHADQASHQPEPEPPLDTQQQ